LRAFRPEASRKEAGPVPDTVAVHRRVSLGLGISSLFSIPVLTQPGKAEVEDAASSDDIRPFLQSAGAKGILAEEEAQLLELRKVRERLAQQELQQYREELEKEARRSISENGPSLCATPFGVDVVGITEFVALLGALIGGIAARQRKDEVERLNEQLRKINYQLRQQARAGMSYAPGLTYAPSYVTTGKPSGNSPLPPVESSTDDEVAPRNLRDGPPIEVTTGLTMDDDSEPPSRDSIETTRALKEGKRFLKEKSGAAAMVRFEKALMLSRATGDKIAQRRAFRGLAAAERLQGQYRAAIKHLFDVLAISKELEDTTGDADAYGSIADLYTDLNDYDNAAKYYDIYIEEMRKLS